MDHPFPEQMRVEKGVSEDGDAHPTGAQGRVLLALRVPVDAATKFAGQYGYFVEWDDMAGIPVFVAGFKLKALPAH